MSVRKINNLLENKGCVLIVSILTLAGVAGGVGTGSCNRNQQRDSQPDAVRKDTTPPVLRVGDFVVTSGQINDSLQQMQQSGQQLTPDLAGFQMSMQIGNAYNDAIYAKLLADEKVEVPESELRKAAEQAIQDELEKLKYQLIMSRKLAPNGTDADFIKAAQAEGIDIEGARKRIPEIVKSVMEDPSKLAQLKVQAGVKQLLAKYESEVKPTDDELKKGLDGIVAKRILITPEKAGKQSPKERADAVLKEIKAGLSFDAAMDKYSGDAALPGKKMHENVLNLTRNMLQDPVKSALATAKSGDVTGVLEVPEGAAIYRVDKVAPNVPKDFDKQKERLAKEFAQNQAQARLSAKVTAMRKSGGVTWESKAAQAMYELSEVYQINDPAARFAKLKQLFELTKGETLDDEGIRRINALARYRILLAIEQSKAPGSAEFVKDDKIQATEDVLQYFEDSKLRLDFATLLADRKDKRAYESLRFAAERNISALDQLVQAQSTQAQIEALAKRLETLGLMDANQKTELGKIFKDYYEARKLAIEREKQMDAERKKAEEEQRKAQEELKKAKPSARPIPPSPSPSATASGAPSPSPSK